MSANCLSILRNQLVTFLDELIEKTNDSNFILLRIAVKDQITSEDIMTLFIQHVLPHKAEIKDRNENFVLENNPIFSKLDSSQSGQIKKYWRKFDKEDRDVIWKWFEAFISLVERYQKLLENENTKKST